MEQSSKYAHSEVVVKFHCVKFELLYRLCCGVEANGSVSRAGRRRQVVPLQPVLFGPSACTQALVGSKNRHPGPMPPTSSLLLSNQSKKDNPEEKIGLQPHQVHLHLPGPPTP